MKYLVFTALFFAIVMLAPATGQPADEAVFMYALLCGLVLGWLSMALFLSPFILSDSRRPHLKLSAPCPTCKKTTERSLGK